MGLPVYTYLGYKILQPENDISSGKDTSVLFFLLSYFTYFFSISGYSQLNMNHITGASQIVEYEKIVRQSMPTCRARVAVKYRIPVKVFMMADDIFIFSHNCQGQANNKRQNIIHFCKGLYLTFKLALDQKNAIYLSSYSPLNEGYFSMLTNSML